jgi:hypothetical protein
VVQGHALGVEEGLERADLVEDAVGEFLPSHLHLAPAEALQVRQRRMGADLDAELLRAPDRRAHVVEIRAVEAARDVGDGDVGHDRFVIAHAVEAEALAHVAIDDSHGSSSTRKSSPWYAR